MRLCSSCGRCYADGAADVTFCVDDGQPLTEGRDIGPDAVAGFTLERRVDRHATVETYIAGRNDTTTTCIVKILPSGPYNENFLADARAAVAFFHPHVADVYEAGNTSAGDLYVASEFPAGRSLRALITDGLPDLLSSIEMLRQTAEAVHALHLKGLAHRAVRPENIVVTTDADGSSLVRLHGLDFGGAEEHAIVSNKFLIDESVDRLRYFAPEQFDAEETTSKADIYSLGIVFYEMLAGRPPFDSPKAAGLIEKHRRQHPPELTIRNFDLRMLIGHALLESLGKQPFMRQSSALAFARQLRHIEQLATHTSTPPAAMSDTSEQPPQRKPVQVEIFAAPEKPKFITPVEKVPPTPKVEPAPAAPPEPENLVSLHVENVPESVPASEPVIAAADLEPRQREVSTEMGAAPTATSELEIEAAEIVVKPVAEQAEDAKPVEVESAPEPESVEPVAEPALDVSAVGLVAEAPTTSVQKASVELSVKPILPKRAVRKPKPRPSMAPPEKSVSIIEIEPVVAASASEPPKARAAAAGGGASEQKADDHTVYVPALGRRIHIKWDDPDDDAASMETLAFRALSRRKAERPRPEPPAIPESPAVAAPPVVEPEPLPAETIPAVIETSVPAVLEAPLPGAAKAEAKTAETPLVGTAAPKVDDPETPAVGTLADELPEAEGRVPETSADTPVQVIAEVTPVDFDWASSLFTAAEPETPVEEPLIEEPTTSETASTVALPTFSPEEIFSWATSSSSAPMSEPTYGVDSAPQSARPGEESTADLDYALDIPSIAELAILSTAAAAMPVENGTHDAAGTETLDEPAVSAKEESETLVPAEEVQAAQEIDLAAPESEVVSSRNKLSRAEVDPPTEAATAAEPAARPAAVEAGPDEHREDTSTLIAFAALMAATAGGVGDRPAPIEEVSGETPDAAVAHEGTEMAGSIEPVHVVVAESAPALLSSPVADPLPEPEVILESETETVVESAREPVAPPEPSLAVVANEPQPAPVDLSQLPENISPRKVTPISVSPLVAAAPLAAAMSATDEDDIPSETLEAAAPVARKKVDVFIPDDDIPTEDAVREALRQDGLGEPARVEPLVYEYISPRAAAAAAAGNEPAFEAEPVQEIVVEPEEVTQPAMPRHHLGLASEDGFEDDERPTLPRVAAPVLATHARSSRFSVGRGALLILCLVAAGFAIYTVVGAYLTGSGEVAATENPNGYSSKRQQSAGSQPQSMFQNAPAKPAAPVQTPAPTTADPFSNSDEPPPLPDSSDRTHTVRNGQTNEVSETAEVTEPQATRSSRSRQPAAADDEPQPEPPTQIASSRPSAPALKTNPPIESSIVITYDKEKARASVMPIRPKTQTSQPARSSGDGSTRPRVVQDPR